MVLCNTIFRIKSTVIICKLWHTLRHLKPKDRHTTKRVRGWCAYLQLLPHLPKVTLVVAYYSRDFPSPAASQSRCISWREVSIDLAKTRAQVSAQECQALTLMFIRPSSIA